MTLRFPEPLESAFRRDHFDRSLSVIRVGLLLGAALYGLFSFLDGWMLPETKDVAFFLRFGVGVPVLLATFLLTFGRSFERHMELILSSALVVAASGIALMLAFAAPSEQGFYSYYEGLILSITFSFTLLRLRFVHVAWSSLFILASYEIVALVVHDALGAETDAVQRAAFISSNFFLVSTVIVAMVAAYSIESYARNNFRQRLQIEEDREMAVEQQRRVQEAMDELRIAESRLVQSERMAALGALVAGLVHELSSPVAAIQSSRETAERALDRMDVAGTSPEASSRHVQLLRSCGRTVDEAARRMGELLSSLKRFTHLDRASFAVVDLHASLDATLELLGSAMRGRVEVIRDYGDVPPLACYPAELNQLFMNVIRNAIQAIPERGTVRVSTRVEGAEVRIIVADDGIGMGEEQLERVFVPAFSREGSRVKAGLGLFVSYEIAEKHGGRIELQSEPGVGTTVIIAIPLGADKGEGNRTKENSLAGERRP
jgi:two-component system, NtrC family, sensor kinase